jgi:hypothetical protein
MRRTQQPLVLLALAQALRFSFASTIADSPSAFRTPTVPHQTHTMGGPNHGTGKSSGTGVGVQLGASQLGGSYCGSEPAGFAAPAGQDMLRADVRDACAVAAVTGKGGSDDHAEAYESNRQEQQNSCEEKFWIDRCRGQLLFCGEASCCDLR